VPASSAERITISSPSLRSALQLSAADRRWIDYLTQTVLDTWDPENPSRPKTHGYLGSEDAIRMHFEEYILSLLSSMAYQIYHENLTFNAIPMAVGNIPDTFPDPGDTATDFNPEFLAMWRSTHNFKLFNKFTEGVRIFDMIEPRHPNPGGLSVEDLQRRFAQNLAELHIDERVRVGKEVAGRTLQVGRERVEAGLRGVWAEVEKARQQRREKRRSRSRGADDKENHPAVLKNEDSGSWQVVDEKTLSSKSEPGSSPEKPFSTPDQTSAEQPAPSNPSQTSTTAGAWTASLRDRAAKVDTAQIQASARESAAKAGAYLSSWGNWAKERYEASQKARVGGSIPSNPETDRRGRESDAKGGGGEQGGLGGDGTYGGGESRF
jgi:hypothetical protein